MNVLAENKIAVAAILFWRLGGKVLRDLVEELVHHFPDALVEEGTPIAASISPRNWNFRFISPLVAGNTEGSSHRLVSSGSSSAISRG